jgi:predicted deacylase
MIRAISYTGLEKGPRFLVIGAIHGNEKCGTVACERVMAEIDSGTLKIARGRVTFVPIGNPRAYAENRRYAERNLNRFLVPMLEPDCYEASLGNILCPMLADCDAHLAIHSYTVGGEAFVIVAPNDETESAFARALGPRVMLTGWVEAYARTGRQAKRAGDEESTGSIEYARRNGAIAVNIECGQHDDPQAPDIAYRAIRNALRHFSITDETNEILSIETSLIKVTHVYYHEDGGRFPQSWKHLQTVSKDEILAFRPDGSTINAPDNGVIIMPKENSSNGEEWFYFGVEAEKPQY